MANKFPNPDGRYKIELTDEDWANAEKMAHIQCTGEEISAILGLDYDTFLRLIKDKGYNSFSDWFKKYSAGGKMSLRRRQFKMSETNPALCIWLGKQYLGQRDNHDFEISRKPVKIFDPSKLTKEEYKALLAERLDKKDQTSE